MWILLGLLVGGMYYVNHRLNRMENKLEDVSTGRIAVDCKQQRDDAEEAEGEENDEGGYHDEEEEYDEEHVTLEQNVGLSVVEEDEDEEEDEEAPP